VLAQSNTQTIEQSNNQTIRKMHQEYTVVEGDFVNAGKASSSVKKTLKQLKRQMLPKRPAKHRKKLRLLLKQFITMSQTERATS
jgi:hypothetical protein